MAGYNPYNSGRWTPQGTWNPYQYPQATDSPYGYSWTAPRKPPVDNILRVTGPESAKAYSLPPNSNVVLFDADNPIFYIKTTDDSGFASIRTFEFSEISDQPQAVQPDPGIEALRNEIAELRKIVEGLM